MKALLIADDEKAITNISEVLKSAGYDVIVYKWLLKAMDNLEEIKPHLIVISTKDYPRHWKTLAQYASGINSDYKPELILYAEEPLSEDELKKAETLRVRGIFNSCEVEGLDKLRQILSKTPDIFSGYLTDPEQGEVTLKDILPELSDLKDISKDIDSLKEELNRPFDINEAITKLEEAKKDSENQEQDSEDSKNPEDSTQDSEDKKNEDSENLAAIEKSDDSDGNAENSENHEEPKSDEKNNLEDDNESDIIEGETSEIPEPESLNETEEGGSGSEPEENKMNEEDIEAKLAAIMDANKADAKEKAEEAGIDKYSCGFVFTNPITLAMVTGTARNFNGLTLEFTPDIPNFIMNLAPDTQISSASLKVNGKISDVKAEVMSNDAKKIYLQIKK